MNLFLRLRSVLAALSQDLATELDALVKRLNTWGAKEHHTDGTHSAVTAESVTSDTVMLTDGVTAPAAAEGLATIYIDSADGDLKVVFADGTVKTIVTDT